MQKYSLTYYSNTPGGYGGVHRFFTVREKKSFIARAVARGVGIEWIKTET